MRKRVISDASVHGSKKAWGEDYNTCRTSQTSRWKHTDQTESFAQDGPSQTAGDDVNPSPENVPREDPVVRGLNVGERIQLQFLRGEIRRAQNTVDFLLKANQEALKKNEELPPHCNPKLVKKIANSVVSDLLLEKELLYPSEEIQQAALMTEFGISASSKDSAYEEFLKAWSDSCNRPNFKQIMNDAMRRRKGTLTKTLREELYLQLGVRKYHRGASVEERLHFTQELEKSKLHDMWRISEEEDGIWDPWGSGAVHAAISKAIYGVHYIPSQRISLSLELASFIFYVLTLAMEDRNLQGNERLTLAGELSAMGKKSQNGIHL